MGKVSESILQFKSELEPFGATLVAISKTKPVELIREGYETGHLHFGENKVQELVDKQQKLPPEIRWHMVGHLQRNKVKYIAPFVHLIHSVDSLKLLQEINKQAIKHDRVISILLQVHIAMESTKFGLNESELLELLNREEFRMLKNVRVEGLMGMATNTNDRTQISFEFSSLKKIYDKVTTQFDHPAIQMTHLSMGMTGDYKIALENGSTMIRIGSAIFGERNY